jgi:SAM-dependent methyltransferase
MAPSEFDRDALRRQVTDAVLGPDFRRATFGGAVRGQTPSPWVRVVIRTVELRGQPHLQFSYFDAKKDTTKNYPPHAAHEPLAALLAVGFAGIHLTTRTEEIDIRTTKKGKILVGRRTVASPDHADMAHNRTKDVPLPEGRADRVLEVMGILTADGRVRPTMRAKYTQINEFLKQLLHVLDAAGLRSLGRPIDILDCGCGSSYLTIAVHHYLNDVLALPSRITGVDVNEEVIRKSVARSQRLGAGDLNFACEHIGAVDSRADIVLALHACDTATDDAIAQAIRSEARLLLSVPCCHQNLNHRLKTEGSAAVLRPVFRHGILRERTADIVTDAFRALVLRIMGYRTDVVEFVSAEHTARNLMIRAVRGLPPGDAAHVAEYLEMKRFWGVTPYVERLLGEPFRQFLTAGSAVTAGASAPGT